MNVHHWEFDLSSPALTPDIDLTGKRVTQSNNKWFQINFNVNTECTFFELILCIGLVSKETEASNRI